MKTASQTATTRDAILDAAENLLARFGYKKMTIDDLAREVGIGKGSIYLHFTSKEEIALSHIDRIIERLKARLRDIAATDRPIEQKLESMLIERVMFRFDSVQHYTQSLNELLAQLRPSLLDRRKRYFEEEAGIFAVVIVAGQDTGELSPADPADIARTLLTATNALLPYSLSSIELGHRTEIAKRTRKIAETLIRGIKREI